MSLSIRPYRDADFDVIVPMVKEMHRNAAGHTHISTENVCNTIAHFHAHPDSGSIWILEWSSELCGYAILVDFYSNDWNGLLIFLDELFVVEQYRNKGIGKMFLGWLRENYSATAAAILLETTPDNDRAASLYQRFGFEPAENNYWILPFRKIEYLPNGK